MKVAPQNQRLCRVGLYKHKIVLDSLTQEEVRSIKMTKMVVVQRNRRQLKFGHSPLEKVGMEMDSPIKTLFLKGSRSDMIVEGEHDVAFKKLKETEDLGVTNCVMQEISTLSFNMQ